MALAHFCNFGASFSCTVFFGAFLIIGTTSASNSPTSSSIAFATWGGMSATCCGCLAVLALSLPVLRSWAISFAAIATYWSSSVGTVSIAAFARVFRCFNLSVILLMSSFAFFWDIFAAVISLRGTESSWPLVFAEIRSSRAVARSLVNATRLDWAKSKSSCSSFISDFAASDSALSASTKAPPVSPSASRMISSEITLFNVDASNCRDSNKALMSLRWNNNFANSFLFIVVLRFF